MLLRIVKFDYFQAMEDFLRVQVRRVFQAVVLVF
jgi:hypothetical protein